VCFDFIAVAQHWQFCFKLQKAAGPPNVGDLQTIANTCAAWWQSNLSTRLSPSVALAAVTATDITAQGAPQRFALNATVGTAGGLSLPLNAPAVVSLRTALRGRSYRGRIYISGLTTNAQLDMNNITIGFAGQLSSDVSQIFTALSGLGFQAIVASGQHNGVTTTPRTVQPITTLVVDQPIDSQRRRLTGRGT